MFQGMFRKRGRPPEPPLQIGGYDNPGHEESNQIPAHQLRDAPRQLPLPAVREFEQNVIIEQERPGFNNAIVESSSSQQTQHDVDMLDSHNRRLIANPRETMPSQREIRVAFQRLISPLKVADEGFRFHQDLLVSQAFGTQKISDEDVLKWCETTLLEDVAGGPLRAVSAPPARIFAFSVFGPFETSKNARKNGEHALDHFS